MECVVIDCLACPVTGTFFSSVISQDNTWFIVWFEDGPILQTGDLIETIGDKAFFGYERDERTLLLVSLFHVRIWKLLQKSTYCCGERRIKPQFCLEQRHCRFSKCPYGIRKV